MEHIMTLHNVSASYDGREVLSDLSLDIPSNQITAIIGPSGCLYREEFYWTARR